MLGSASLVHPGLGTGGLTDLSGLESLVSNSQGGGDLLGGHHSHHTLHHSTQHQLHQLHSGQHHSHHHHQLHHPPNQPLPPHRPFTPPGSLGGLTSHATSSSSSVLNNNNNNNSIGSVVDSSYSPNSTTNHLPSSTVKVKPGK